MNPTIKTSQLDGVRVIVLNRPDSRNAINLELLDGLNTALTEAQAADDVRCIVLCGEGGSFCAGDDLKAQGEIHAAGVAALSAQAAAIQQVTMGIMFGAKPVIGAIEGWAVGAGLSWTLNCDLTVWAKTARGFFPELKYGAFFSGGATYLLPTFVGTMRAREIMFSGRKLSAQEVFDLGWASHLVEEGEALGLAIDLAQELAAKPVTAIRWTKRAFSDGMQAQLLAAMARESAGCLEAALSPDTLARMQAGLQGASAE
ncbi:MAG TPA: enoyl-CoA hydratase/isomerase family protein [Sphingobium sp.]